MSFVSWFLKSATVLIFSIKNVRGTREDSENLKVIVEKDRVTIRVWFCGQGKHLDGAGECAGAPTCPKPTVVTSTGQRGAGLR